MEIIGSATPRAKRRFITTFVFRMFGGHRARQGAGVD